MKDKYFIDTNILVYAHDTAHLDKQLKAQEVIFSGLRKGNAVISTQVLNEFFVIVTQKIKNPLSELKAKNEIILLSHFEIVEIDMPIIIRAIDIKAKWKINYWDALIFSCAERSGCSFLYSEDFSDGHNYDSIKVRNIFVGE